MQIEFIEKKIDDINADIEIIVVVDKNFDHRFVKKYKEVLKSLDFKGEQDEVVLLADSKKLFVGSNSLNSNDIRSAIASAVRKILDKKYKSLKIALYSKFEKCTATIRAQAEGLSLGSYYYNRYKRDFKVELERIIISFEPYDKTPPIEALKGAIDRGIKIALSVNFVRDIVNTPPDDFYPKIMAKVAKDIANEYKLEVNILKKKDIKREKMNALLAVARASSRAPRVIHLAYKPKNPKKKVALIGKGLTYDSGGLSLKPSDFMVTMKLDKSGGAAVLGIIEAVAKLKLDIEVHGFIGAVENMIGGNAYKPDDVLITKSGKTIEVRNTDAEGRIVLADVLAYAQEKVDDADYYIDIATLTGACVVGLGQYTMGVMGNNIDLIEKFKFAANISAGESAAYLPFNRHLKKSLKSNIADICNIANTRYGGAITAAMFLDFFIEDKNKDKWLHLDIAGPAFVEHEWGENPSGASGASVRAVTRFIEKLTDNKH
ncbi:MAG: leucyl aminopeptidase [Epsilonproteobacteria bacterium]|nr:leucyl aminopeptidase [Campylobacterota bacterium]